MRRSWLLLLCVAVLGANAQSPVSQPLKVSMVQLLAAPERFDGKLVLVQGFLDMSREGDLLFLHQEDCKNLLLENAIWVRRTEQMGKDRLRLDGRYVSVLGVFRVGSTKQLGAPVNGIPDVRNVSIWSDPSFPLHEKLNTIPGVTGDH
jgi:hypothetical protein